MKAFCLIPFLLFLAGCKTSEPVQPVVIKENKVKDEYIDKVEDVVSDAASGVLAVKETLPKESIQYKVLDAQVTRLSGIKPPSVVKLTEYRATVANNDTKAAAKDKAKAVEVDQETTKLYSRVAVLDSQLADEKLRRAESDRVAERALKEKQLGDIQKLGMGIMLVGVILVAFVSPLRKSGAILIASGAVIIAGVLYWDSPFVKWVIYGSLALIAIEVVFICWKKGYEHFFRKTAGQETGSGQSNP
jgi:hypothetical protein